MGVDVAVVVRDDGVGGEVRRRSILLLLRKSRRKMDP